jgi:hypothetical protein
MGKLNAGAQRTSGWAQLRHNARGLWRGEISCGTARRTPRVKQRLQSSNSDQWASKRRSTEDFA